RMVPEWGLYPMVVLASVATIIASQAVISGAFSLTRQAVQLGYLPRLEVRHTSAEEIGQIFVPRVNKFLFVAVIAVVLGFRTSDNLGAAYGIAVTCTMTIDSILAAVYMRGVLRWDLAKMVPLFAVFLIIDFAFLAANLLKIEEGGWFPLVLASMVAIAMSTWRWGRQALLERRARNALTLEEFVATLKPGRPIRVPGTAIFMTGNAGVIPGALLHNLKHNKVLHEHNVVLTIVTADTPRVIDEERVQMRQITPRFTLVALRFGYMETPNVPKALAVARKHGWHFDIMSTSFFLSRRALKPAAQSGMPRWQDRLFIGLAKSASDASDFFQIPTGRVVEVGTQVTI
ncbi:MAG: KUP/HAK/KT family potassium transporter, partial [Xanthobacteraceae bacterium]